MRELRAFATMATGHVTPAEGYEPPAVEDGSLEAAGFVLSADTLRDLDALDLTSLAIPDASGRRVLLLGRDRLTPDRRLHAHLEASGVELHIGDGEGFGDMVTHPQFAQRPHATIARTVRWIADGDGTSRDAPRAVAAPGPDAVPLGEGSRAIVERAFEFDYARQAPDRRPHRARTHPAGAGAADRRPAQRRGDPPHRPQPHVGRGRASLGRSGDPRRCASTPSDSETPTETNRLRRRRRGVLPSVPGPSRCPPRSIGSRPPDCHLASSSVACALAPTGPSTPRNTTRASRASCSSTSGPSCGAPSSTKRAPAASPGSACAPCRCATSRGRRSVAAASAPPPGCARGRGRCARPRAACATTRWRRALTGLADRGTETLLPLLRPRAAARRSRVGRVVGAYRRLAARDARANSGRRSHVPAGLGADLRPRNSSTRRSGDRSTASRAADASCPPDRAPLDAQPRGASSSAIRATFARSSVSAEASVANQASRISLSTPSPTARRLSASTFASFQRRAPAAVGASAAERRADAAGPCWRRSRRRSRSSSRRSPDRRVPRRRPRPPLPSTTPSRCARPSASAPCTSGS